MTQQIPDLTLDETNGTGKLNTFKVRRSSGTESGRYQMDVAILCRVDNIDQARELETMFSGAAEDFQKSFGDSSDGKRKRDYVPVDQDVKVTLSSTEKGRVIFEGPAEVRLARYHVSAKASTVMVNLRCHRATSQSGHSAMDFLGEDIDIEWEKTQLGLPLDGDEDEDAAVDSTQGETNADEAKLVPKVQSLIVVRGDGDGEVEFGIVRAIDGEGADAVVAYSDIGVSSVSTCTLDQIDNNIQVCTPKGATTKKSLQKVWDKIRQAGEEAGKPATVRAITVAIASANGRGLIDEGENGWPITDAVISLAAGKEPRASEVA